MEILSQTEIIEQTGGWPAGIVLILAVLVFIGLAILFGFFCKLDQIGIIISLVLTILIFFATSSIWNSKNTPTGRYEYKVVLDKAYPATQLYEKYEVVGQEGKIWIIQDKESKD